MKKILGLDLGTNSIGWALVEHNFEQKEGKILGMGSRIIPMDADIMGDFDKGNSVSQTKNRTSFRGTRRLRERSLLRRERLHRVLNVLGFLPEHYSNSIGWDKNEKKTFGTFINYSEPKLAWELKENGKYEFLFKPSFEEMLCEFSINQPQLIDNNKKVPYDWTIYYLRKKALSEKITKQELAWIILNFNQKRGYYQLRGEDEEEAVKVPKTRQYFDKKTVKNLIDTGKEYKGLKVIIVELEDGNKGKIFKKEIPKWIGLEINIIATIDLDADGKDKIDDDGLLSQRFKILTDVEWETEWKLIKLKTEKDLKESGKSVGTYIYETLLQNPSQKVKGKLVRTIERKFFREELIAILNKQILLQPELFTDELYNECIRELYQSNEMHQTTLSKRNSFVHLLVDDIIFYQRPLRSQKSSIGNCSFEYVIHKVNKKDDKGNRIKNVYEKDKDGNDIEIKEYLKGISKSNPYYQEFRVWQWMYNLKIYLREDDKEVTDIFIKNTEDRVALFEFLMSKKEVVNKDVIEFLLIHNNKNAIEQEIRILFPKLKDEKIEKKIKTSLKEIIKSELPKYRWNYVFDNSKDKEENKSKKYPCNETGVQIRTCLANCVSRENKPLQFNEFLTNEIEYHLWHIIYSVKDSKEYEQALETFAKKHNLYYAQKDDKGIRLMDDKCFVQNFKKFPTFKSEYGSFSEKAIKKLLPLMRLGIYWDENAITDSVRSRANSIKERLQAINFDEKEFERISDDDIQKQVLKSFLNVSNFTQGLKLYQASYLVYERHSESESSEKWKTINDLEKYIKEFKQHSLRNPIVEQVITETLRVVRDIWISYGNQADNFFDEIHIELSRNMKNTAEKRAKITNQISGNENTNLRIKAMLLEFAKDNYFKNENKENTVKPYSKKQHDILKIYEEDVLCQYSEQELKYEKSGLKDKEGKDISIFNISNNSFPTNEEIQKYKLWLEQKYRSPYTGKIISLSRLFTPDYEIEHIIPQSRYFDDSLSNKVICEAAVNKLKDRYLGLEFIKNHHGEKVECGMNNVVEIFREETYIEFVKEQYNNNYEKRKKLLMEDLPDKMIQRQLNDTRFISKYVSNLLSNIVRNDKDDYGVNSNNLIQGNGKITDLLKNEWGLNNVWNNLILPRFERMNQLTQTDKFTSINKEGKVIPSIPLELSKGFQKKRIDHRHHAMDALVIAVMTREHVQYLNNENAKSQKYHLQKGLAQKIRKYETIEKTIQEKDINGVWRIKVDNNGKQITKTMKVPKEYLKPWNSFTADAQNSLENVIISFKQNLRVINNTTNKYQIIKDGKKEEVNQKGVNWAIRKPLHKETFFGKIYLHPKEMSLEKALQKIYDSRDINIVVDKKIRNKINSYFEKGIDISLALKDDELKCISNVKIYNQYAATRFLNDLVSVFKDIKDADKAIEIIEKITDTGIQNILFNHLIAKDNKPENAFSPEGIEEMNKNIITLNNGKFHQPIYKVRMYQALGNKFSVGVKGNKKDKYVVAEAGTNLFLLVYEYNGKRNYETIPLNEVIEHQKWRGSLTKYEQKTTPIIPIKNNRGRFLFYLCPNDLVYVPTLDEKEKREKIDFNNLTQEQMKRIYKLTDASGSIVNFIPASIADVLFNMNNTKQNKLFGKVIYSIQNEIGVGSQGSKNQNAITGEMIKEDCIKLNIDRLGNIKSSI